MATLFLAAADSDAFYSAIFLAIVGACIIVWIILYFVSPKVRGMTQGAWDNISKGIQQGKSSPSKEMVVLAGTEEQQNRILAAIGTELSRVGYVPQSSQPWLYTYTKDQKPSAGVAVLLFLLCIIPMIIYLVTANKKLILTVRFVDQGAGRFRVVAEGPGPGRAAVARAVAPHSV